MSIHARFIGGPLDGKTIALPEIPPALHIPVAHVGSLKIFQGEATDLPTRRTARYENIGPAADGTLLFMYLRVDLH